MINQAQMLISANFGAVLRILLATERKLFKLVSIAVQVLPAIRMNQVYVHCDERGEPVGYAVWAFLSERVAAEYQADATRLLHYSEWNEGLQLWIIDFVAPFGHAREMATCLRTSVLVNHKTARGIRRREDGRVVRVVEIARRARRGTCLIDHAAA